MVGGAGEYVSTTPVASESGDNPGTPNSRSCCSTPAPSAGGGSGNDGAASGISDSPTNGKSKTNCNTEHPTGKVKSHRESLKVHIKKIQEWFAIELMDDIFLCCFSCLFLVYVKVKIEFMKFLIMV